MIKLARTSGSISRQVAGVTCVVLALVAVMTACSGRAEGPDKSTSGFPPSDPTNVEIERSLGTELAHPVFQCGTTADSLNEDAAPGSVTVFEGGPVRPLAVSADGSRLYVVNAPANCLEIYSVTNDVLTLISSIAVGMEPVAVAERNGREVWVVNHLSDSVSVVRLDGTPRVLRTLLVGDEPRDIVFAGSDRDRAFVTAAFRGQNRPGFRPDALTTPGLGRADVWVFDAAHLNDSLNGQPVAIVNLFADTPRALAVSADGRTVYAAPYMSGNQTTSLSRTAVLGSKPGPFKNVDGITAPNSALIVRYDGSAWRDSVGTDWSSKVKFSLPDYDVFAIDATSPVPTVKSTVSGIGTTLFNMAVNPRSGRLYVSNTQAINHVRFEGPGGGGSTVRGRIAENRVSVVDLDDGSVDAVHLNPHIDFSLPQGTAVVASDKAKSLAQPTAMVFDPSGRVLYVAAFGSASVAALPVASLSSIDFVPDATRHISVPDGPAGLAVNQAGSRLYVYSHIAHQLSIIDTATQTSRATATLFSPESVGVRTGRRFLYDAKATSSNGTTSCSSCHAFGDMDHLAWDLGNPDDGMKNNTNLYVTNSPQRTAQFHPLKGPMSTQTLRGIKNNGPLHWRGDRIGANRQTVRGSLESLESASFKEFNPAFVSLMGRENVLDAGDMQALTDFVLSLTMPPNPVRALDNSLTASQQAGRDIYFNVKTLVGLGNFNVGALTEPGSCNLCHTLNVNAMKFGTSGLMSFQGSGEDFKVPQLRNVHQKVGMFGFSGGDSANSGAQVRGFGFLNDGSEDTVDTFFQRPVFSFPAPAATTRAQVVSFVMAMDSDLDPIVGQQVTWRPKAGAEVETRLELLKQRSRVDTPRPECDLVVRASASGKSLSGLYQRDGAWRLRDGRTLSQSDLIQVASASQPLTFTCLPPGSGQRAALDRL